MIYIYSRDINFIPFSIFISLTLENVYDIKNFFVTDFKRIDPKNDIVIPFGVTESQECYNMNIRRALLNKPEIYDLLDNKATCYQFIKSIDIPTIDTHIVKNSTFENLDRFIGKYDNKSYFILKEIYSLDSHNLYVKNKFETIELFNEGNIDQYVIQPYLDGYSLFNCNLLAVNGDLVEFLVITQSNNYEKDNIFGRNMFENERFILDESHPYFNRIVEYSKKIVSETNYSGFSDIEFLCKGNEIFLLEINPRVSGQIFTLIDGKPIYIDFLILNYLYYLETGKTKKKIGKLLEKNSKKYYNKKPNKTITLTAFNLNRPLKWILIFTILFIIILLLNKIYKTIKG